MLGLPSAKELLDSKNKELLVGETKDHLFILRSGIKVMIPRNGLDSSRFEHLKRDPTNNFKCNFCDGSGNLTFLNHETLEPEIAKCFCISETNGEI